jgi:glc operon protein GlcG
MRKRYALNLDEAEVMVSAAKAEALREGWAVAIAIVDDAGIPILVARMDEASKITPSVATEKARSAAMIGISTRILETMAAERPALATLGCAIEGGFPIQHQGQTVGGIGVSGATSEQDAQVAEAGLKALQA